MTAHQKWLLAQEHLVKRELPQALQLLNEALAEDANNANYISERAVVYFHMGDKNMALMELDKAVALDPNNPYRYSSRAYIKSSMKMTKGAILDYEKCVQLDPDDAIAYNNLGILLEAAGKIEAAKRHFKKADELEGILNERGISLPEAEVVESDVDGSISLTKKQDNISEPAKKEVVMESEAKPTEPITPSKWNVIKNVFTKKEAFKEYVRFVKNGFRK